MAAEHARALAERLDHQEVSVERFLETERVAPGAADIREGGCAELRAVRRVYIVGIAAAILLVLVISAMLARVFSANSAEQSATDVAGAIGGQW